MVLAADRSDLAAPRDSVAVADCRLYSEVQPCSVVEMDFAEEPDSAVQMDPED